MDSTIPADLLKLKARLEAWRATRKYARQPIPDEFRQAAAEMTERHPPSLVRRVLKLDPWRTKKPATKKSDRAHHKPQTAFFTLPPEPTLLLPGPSAQHNLPSCHLQIERPDGSRLTLTLSALDLGAARQIAPISCALEISMIAA
jgi:anti-sigma factor RsiW